MKYILVFLSVTIIGASSLCAQEKPKGPKDPMEVMKELKKLEERQYQEGLKKAKEDIAQGKPRLYVFEIEGPALIEAKKQIYLARFGVKTKMIKSHIDERRGKFAAGYNDWINKYLYKKYGADVWKAADSEIGRLFLDLSKREVSDKK